MSQKERFGNFYQGVVLDLLFSLWASGGCKFDNLIIFDLINKKIRLRFVSCENSAFSWVSVMG